MTLTIGELCAGYGGLGMAVEEVFGARLAWVSEYETAPSKILAHHWPDVPNLGDMTRIDWAAVEPVDIISGGTPCFPAGTLIDTADGYRAIETIRIGDLVRTHRQRYMPVVQLMRRQASDTITVKAMGSPAFVTTREHPFYVRTKSRVWNNDRRQYDRVWSEPEWVPAGLLDTSSFVGFQIDQRDETVPALGEALAYIVGRWLGDGWVRNSKRPSSVPQGSRGSRVTSLWWQAMICCAHGEADFLAEKFKAANLHATPSPQRTTVRFVVSSTALVKLLTEFGKGAHGKRIPGWVYRLPIEDQRAIWQGWSEADGSISPTNGMVQVTTVSPELAHGMARVARNVFRRGASVHHSPMPATHVIEGRTVNQRDQYKVVLPTTNREAVIDGEWVWTPVRSVTDAPTAEVFNFGVAEDESYTAWGLAVHNCQDLSHAGKRAGMTEGTRSNLWVQMREAIATIRPKYVIWENVRGAYSACADSEIDCEMGRCPRCMDPDSGLAHAPNLRALGRVVGDLSALGYLSGWHGISASDVGAPHGRMRVFVVAQDANCAIGNQWWQPAPGQAQGGRARADIGGRGGAPAPDTRIARLEGLGGQPCDAGQELAADHRATTPDPSGDGRHEGGSESAGQLGGHDAAIGSASPAAHTVGGGRDGRSRDQIRREIERVAAARSRESAVRWGQYAPAIERWSAVLGRPAPAPTELSARGTHRLSPRFVEWMMGLPAGHVTDVPGISRNDQLKALGNGVVKIQAATAIRHILKAVNHEAL